VYAGTGSGTFGSSLGSTTINDGTIQAGDFNGDGARDIYSAGTLLSGIFNSYLANASSVSTIGRLYMLDRDGAKQAMSAIDTARQRVALERGKIGANLSRIGAALSNLTSTKLNSETAANRITDADIAEESARLVRGTIAQNASQALLAQANQRSQIVLQLLRI
jgi:flagellin